jgi:hypothetical protein
MDEPPPAPGSNAAFTEWEYTARRAMVWAESEAGVVHELCHLLLAGCEDAFDRTTPKKGIRSLYRRREERAIRNLERALLGRK